MRWRCGASSSALEAAGRRTANQLLAEVAKRLGNTVAVCRKAYVHPRVLELLAAVASADAAAAALPAPRRIGLDAAERRLLGLLSESVANDSASR